MPSYNNIINNGIIIDSVVYTKTDKDILYNNLYSVIDYNKLSQSLYTKEILGTESFKDNTLPFDYLVLIDHLMNFQDKLLLLDNGSGVSDEDLNYLICQFKLICIREYFICLYFKINIFDAMFKFIELGGIANTIKITNNKNGFIRI